MRLGGLAGLVLLVASCTSVALLPDGRVLLVSPAGAKLFDPVTGTITDTGSPTSLRVANTWTQLPDGRLLAVGGMDADGALSATAEVFDPATSSFAATGSLTEPRSMHTATVLADGRVLVTGGGAISPAGEQEPALISAEIWDPSTGTFSAAGSMTMPRALHTATLLQDGRVLLAGGSEKALDSAELFDPATGTFTATGSLAKGRGMHTATPLADGRVLLVGGIGGDLDLSGSGDSGKPLPIAEVYDPATGTFTETGKLTSRRWMHSSTLLQDGRVLIVGGVSTDMQSQLTAVEIYDPATGTFTEAGDLPVPYALHSALLLPDGRVLLAGGANQSGAGDLSTMTMYSGIYEPATGDYEPLIDLPEALE
jgi:phosphatidylserine/phosphatidylglycerophosphate/cardiolipin synthase-like enzyme